MFFRYRWHLTTEQQDIAELDTQIERIDTFNPPQFIEERKDLVEFKNLITKIYRLRNELEQILKRYETNPSPIIQEEAMCIAKELDHAFQEFMSRPIRERLLLSTLALFTIGLIVLSILYSYAHLTKDEKILAAGVSLITCYTTFFAGIFGAKTIARFCFHSAKNAVLAGIEKIPVATQITSNPLYNDANANVEEEVIQRQPPKLKIFDLVYQSIQLKQAVETGYQFN